MRTPIITVFVVCILIVGLALAFYDYKKHGAHEQPLDITKSGSRILKEAKQSGDEQTYRGNFKLAIEHYEHALKFSPRDAYLHNNLGAAYYHLGLESMDPPVAEDDIEFGTEVDARLLKGSEPLERVKEAIKKTPSGVVTAVVEDTAAKSQIEAYAISLQNYVHTEEEVDEDGNKEFWLTILTGKTKDAFLEAEKEYLQAIDIKSVRAGDGRKYSNYSAASRNLGSLYFRMGRKKEAIAQWRRALQLEPKDAELRELLGKYE